MNQAEMKRNRWDQVSPLETAKTRRKIEILQKFGKSYCQSADINSFTCLVVKSTMDLQSFLKRFHFNESNSEKELSKVL